MATTRASPDTDPARKRIELAVPGETADLVNRYSRDDRLMRCAVDAMTNVLATHDRAVTGAYADDPATIADEVRRAVAALSVDLTTIAKDAIERTRFYQESIANDLSALRHDAVAARDAVVQTVAASNATAIADMHTAMRQCASDVVPAAVVHGIRDHWSASVPIEKLRGDIQSANCAVEAAVNARADAVASSINGLATTISETRADTTELRRLADLSRCRDTNSSLRGQDGETALAGDLRSRLLVCDGWTVDDVHAQSHACDILVTRTGWPSVRVESKRKKHITRGDMDKFHRDLDATGDHGLMVSVDGACAPGYPPAATYEQITTHAGPRWAGVVVLARDGSPESGDVHHVVAAIKVVQQLAHLTERATATDEGDGITITCANADLACSEITRARTEIAAARDRLKASIADTNAAIACLDRLALRRVIDAIRGRTDQAEPTDTCAGEFVGACTYCGDKFKTASGLSRHVATTCKRRPQLASMPA